MALSQVASVAFLALLCAVLGSGAASGADFFGLDWGMSHAQVAEVVSIDARPHGLGRQSGIAYWAHSLPVKLEDRGVIVLQFGYTDELVRMLVSFGVYNRENYVYQGKEHPPEEDPARGYWVTDFRWAEKKFNSLVELASSHFERIDCYTPRLKFEAIPGVLHRRMLDRHLVRDEGLWYCRFEDGPTTVLVSIASRGNWTFRDYYEVVIMAQNAELTADSWRRGRAAVQ